MIIVRAPLRVSFIGGGTDLPAFYRKSVGRVLSAAIDKYVYVTITRIPSKRVNVRYSVGESVFHPKELKHNRVREALLDFGITESIEISSFSQLPGQAGLASSSAFSVALIKGLNTLLGKKINARECAEKACDLEIGRVGEPIGKQDQYASAFGGLNVLQFERDGSVEIEPLFLDYRRRLELEDHLLLFFSGILREAAPILAEQSKRTKTPGTFKTLKRMADAVHPFRDALTHGDYKRLGAMLDKSWALKKTLAPGISSPVIDNLYASAMKAGAWGGKLLGAGGGGCFLFVVEPKKRKRVTEVLKRAAREQGLSDSAVIPFSFVHSGAETIHEQ